MIVDALTHITEDGKWLCGDFDASLSALLESMQKNAVDMAVLAGIPTFSDNRLILDACCRHPSHFIPVCGIDTGMPLENITQAVKEAAALGFMGIKIHPRLSGTTFLSEGVHTAIKTAGRHNLTAMICTIQRPPMSPLGRPLYDILHELCTKHDETRLILVHGGYFEVLATSEVIRPLENVLLDVSLTVTRFARSSIGNDIAFLLDTFEKRLCIGSDFPEGDMGRVLNTLTGLGYTQKILEEGGILGANILRFFPQIHFNKTG